MPQVQQGQAVLAEQAVDVIAAVGGDEAVIGQAAGVGELGQCRFGRVRHVQNPGFARVIQGKHEALIRSVHQANGLGALVLEGRGGDIRYQGQVVGREYLHSPGLVVGYGNQFAVLGDGAANAVASLENPFDDFAAQDIDLGQAAIPAENIGIALIPGINHGSMRQITQALNTRQHLVGRGINNQKAAAGAFDDDAHVAGAPGQTFRLCQGLQRQ